MTRTFPSKSKDGFRSGLEREVAGDLSLNRVEYEYETMKISYTQPVKHRKYTPDFILPNAIIIETKGRFTVQDRQKHLWIKEQHPDLDIRFVFSNSRNKISKNSRTTTYADWCAKYGFKYADKRIPTEWLSGK